MGASFHKLWMAKYVRVKTGPFKGWEGRVCATDGPNAGRLQVAFPPPASNRDKPIERLWFNRSDLERVKAVA